MIKINGKELSWQRMTIFDCIESCGYNFEHVVVELNQRIIPKGEYQKIILKDGDILEILNFVGGG